MVEEKNIRLTVVKPVDEGDAELEIDMMAFFAFLWRFLCVWLAAAVAAAAILGGGGILLRDFMPTEGVRAIISFDIRNPALQRTPSANDVISANVVGEALNSLGISVMETETIRNNMSVMDIIPDSVMEQRAMYYEIYNKASNGSMDAVEKLLSTDYTPSGYVLRFDYRKAGYSREEGMDILDAVLVAYRSYFVDTYVNLPLLGTIANSLDYRDYDYAETASLFSSTLDSIQSFLRRYSDSDFRSSKTGCTIQDLLRLADSIQEIDLNRVRAALKWRSIAKRDTSDVVSRYQWLIDENTRRSGVQEGRLAALNAAVAGYQKDPLIYMMDAGGVQAGPGGELNGVYDDLVMDALNTQDAISNYAMINEYYQSMIDEYSLQENQAASAEIEQIEQAISDLNGKINNLLDLANRTMDDYFDNSISNLFQVLMPPQAERPKTISSSLVKTVLIAEGVLLAVWFCAAGWLTLDKARNDAEEKKMRKQEADSRA